MSRILVVGIGTPGFVPAHRHTGPGLRTAHLALALARGGHDVLVVAVQTAHEAVVSEAGDAKNTTFEADGCRPIAVEVVPEVDFTAPAFRRRVEAFAADAVVGVTVYAAALAARLSLAAPLWADVFGDIMAEAQAKAARTGSDWSLVHFWTMLRRVLESADRFSAVSDAQAHALVGQLGLAGRLSARTAGEDLVATIPCAAEAPTTRADRQLARRTLGLPSDDFVLLLSGSVNTWCDIETTTDGIARAMAASAGIRVVVTGGAIPGHDEASHAELVRGLRRIDAARVRVLGWVRSSELAGIYAASDLALHVERPLYERRLGAENRVVEWLAHGLPVLTTALSETTRDLVARAIAFPCATGSAEDLARGILEAARNPARLADASARGARWVESERSFSRTAGPLVEWCASPVPARDRDGARLVRIGLLSHPETSVELLEAYVSALPLRELARRGVRWVWRRATGAIFAVAERAVRSVRTRGRARSAWRSRLPSLFIAACLAIGGAAGCDPAPGRAARPNILLVSVDTLRTDHIGAYGYRATPSPTPAIDRLAAGGVVFEHAISSSPETAPALATLVTGQYQDLHDVMFNRARLADEHETIAERLKAAGYATRAYLANWLVDPEHGFGQGFDAVEMIAAVPGYPSADERLVAAAADFFRAPPDAPWFVWVHMMDPHGPYNSAAPWWSSGFDYANAPIARDDEAPMSDSNFGLGVIPAYQKIEGTTKLSDYVRRYDGEIRYTDAQIGSLLGLLAASGEAADTVVVVTADHGESLVEHDELLQHGWFTYDTTVRVPLIVAWPGRIDARRVAGQVCTVDVFPTLADLAGAAATGGLDGRSLASDLGHSSGAGKQDGGELRAAGCFSIGPRANHPMALRRPDFKMIVTPAGAPTDPRAPKGERSEEPERVELYDLARDPGETTDLAAKRRDIADSMKPEIDRLRSRFRANGWRW